MRRFIAVTTLSLLVIGALTGNASGQDSDLKVRILPMNCQFNVVNTGTYEITYITPEECEDTATPIPPTTPPPSQDIPGLPDVASPTIDTPADPLFPEAQQNRQQPTRQPSSPAPITGNNTPKEDVAQWFGFKATTTESVISVTTATTGFVGMVGLVTDATFFQSRGRRAITRRIPRPRRLRG